jgi:peroxiredoxin
MRKKIITLVILLVFLTVGAVQAESEKGEQRDNLPGLRVGLKAPDFELKNLNGQTVRLSDFKGQKVMLNFWASWCPPCKVEIPEMQKFYQDDRNKITVLAINIDPQSDIKGLVKKMKVHFPILLDEGEKVAKAYQIISIPTTYFIDEKGIIKRKHIGAMSEEKIMEIVNDLLREEHHQSSQKGTF